MKNMRLIMLEGLPATGKSTNSCFLRMQLERNGKAVKWVHEVARPHPTLFFHEASLTYAEYDAFLRKYPGAEKILPQVPDPREHTVGIDLLEIEWNYEKRLGADALQELKAYNVWTFPIEKYQAVTLEKWEFFVQKVLSEKDVIYILDGSILQFHIFRFLLQNMPYESLELFIRKLTEIVKPLHPNLIYFYRKNTGDTIQFLEENRGAVFMEYIWERDKAEPYYADKPGGAESVKLFLRAYGEIAYRLFCDMDCRKLAVEIAKQDWASYEQKMLSFIGIEHKADPAAVPPSGVYTNASLDLHIKFDGWCMKDPGGTSRRLMPKSNTEFYVEGLPVIIRVTENGDLTVVDGQICKRWTTLGTRFIKSETVTID